MGDQSTTAPGRVSAAGHEARAVAAAHWRPADQLVARLLFVTPQAAPERTAGEQDPPQLINVVLLLTALRCTVRYIVLPFGLPFLGPASGAAHGIILLLDLIAVVAATTAVRRLWAVQHPQRWRYLMIGCGALLIIGLFRTLDTLPTFV